MYKRNARLSVKYERINFKETLVYIKKLSAIISRPTLILTVIANAKNQKFKLKEKKDAIQLSRITENKSS